LLEARCDEGFDAGVEKEVEEEVAVAELGDSGTGH
jgi:hypothetical protein